MDKQMTIFGIYPVMEAIEAGSVIDKLYVTKPVTNPRIQQIVDSLQGSDATIIEAPVEKLDRLVRSNHQGVVAITSPISFSSLEELVEAALEADTPPLFLLLDQLSDVRNFGAIIRTAESTGVTGIIIQKKGGAPVSGDTVKTSAGAIFKVPIVKVDHIKDAIYYLKASGIRTIAATEKTSNMVYGCDFTTPVGIVMGSEGKGVSPGVLKIVDEKAALPMLGEINSLNVSVACGAFLYEATRQRLG